MKVRIVRANSTHLDALLPMVCAYHEFEGFQISDDSRAAALPPLLKPGSGFGRVWLIYVDDHLAGYVVLTFGYSIEFGGRDAFIDEFFIQSVDRGRGVGAIVLNLVQEKAKEFGLTALHLIVSKHNSKAAQLYLNAGFEGRHDFQMMFCPLSCPQMPVHPRNGESL